jgi:hypothetical protein
MYSQNFALRIEALVLAVAICIDLLLNLSANILHRVLP